MDVRAAFRKYNYRIPDDSVADKCDDLALITKLSTNELAKELELYLVSRCYFLQHKTSFFYPQEHSRKPLCT